MAFALAMLSGARDAVFLLDSMRTGGDRIGWIFWAHAAFSILTFLYGSLRLSGSITPRAKGLLPARDAARFVD